MISRISDHEIDALHGEPLPPRTALSSVINPLAPGGETITSGGDDPGTTVAYACQYQQDPGPPALLASLGLAPTTPGHTMTCVPAAIASEH
ncbi:hypothetical protein [Saccharopolyspora flava]|uniref:Uncharacterized protein n=1 Tax=Saccharopolyspora flava TaxID=95161 RepID=A0A1I6PIM3_9PSEU|nr:hypothetical protein [Saccharopolyspora flava]SFS40020.1 hypothetical protein SAMN05660874_00823 [Saccharopolyspora flava]